MHMWSKGTLRSCEYFLRKVETLESPVALAVPGWHLQQLRGISFNNLGFPGMLRGGWTSAHPLKEILFKSNGLVRSQWLL